jgi:hypothetical protein
MDNIPNTIDLIDNDGNIDYDRITTFTAADHAFLISYARKMKVPGLRHGRQRQGDLPPCGRVRQGLGFRPRCRCAVRPGKWRFAPWRAM